MIKIQWGNSSTLKHRNRVQKQNVPIIMLQSGPSIQWWYERLNYVTILDPILVFLVTCFNELNCCNNGSSFGLITPHYVT